MSSKLPKVLMTSLTDHVSKGYGQDFCSQKMENTWATLRAVHQNLLFILRRSSNSYLFYVQFSISNVAIWSFKNKCNTTLKHSITTNIVFVLISALDVLCSSIIIEICLNGEYFRASFKSLMLEIWTGEGPSHLCT